ncbi:hypothetical protein J6590_017337 [Homalodisca vitripennis]|nr:hypothetical protein J6590_017337 [Homalodisca vitripennis]
MKSFSISKSEVAINKFAGRADNEIAASTRKLNCYRDVITNYLWLCHRAAASALPLSWQRRFASRPSLSLLTKHWPGPALSTTRADASSVLIDADACTTALSGLSARSGAAEIGRNYNNQTLNDEVDVLNDISAFVILRKHNIMNITSAKMC